MDYISKKDSTIGHRMKKIRSNAHLTQEQLADILGVSVNYLGEVERGRKPLSHSLAASFCNFFQITYDYLYDGSGSRFPNMIRERSLYHEASHSLPGQPQIRLQQLLYSQLQSQLQDCTVDELIILSHLVNAFLDSSRSLRKEQIQQDHYYRQDHAEPEHKPADLS